MPTIKTIKCANCSKLYQIPLKRFNEKSKHGWKSYCSVKCQSEYKNKQIILKCSNPCCNNTFKRIKSETDITNNFCSKSCAAKINNLGKPRNPDGINGSGLNSKKSSLIKLCKNKSCNKVIPSRNTYCSNKCQREYERKPDKYYLNKIRIFQSKHDRLPVKRELSSIYQSILNRFGTWNKAVREAGFEPNPILFANKHFAKDGHKCDSLAEKIIDDWLYSKGIPHNRSVPYPINNNLTCDFVVGNIWIEFFGLYGEVRKYDELVMQKLKIVKQKRIKLIKIYPKDLFPKLNLNQLLKTILDHTNKKNLFLS